ncbi:tetratricopeptide repeat protein [Facilibium subflavum]|uniref:tetratricopeptide repeat protein n=1 Tax=Facilibium subflavum TaxID=2219058 RepID=UPI000E6502B7|nr:tetratricopeptide repeat protein [Facilibium subflavum]
MQIKKGMFFIVSIFTLLLFSGCTTSTTKEMPVPETPSVDYTKAAKINAQLAIVYTQRGMLDRAKEKLLKAESQDDNIAQVFYAKGLYYQYLGLMDTAKDAFQKALYMASEDPQAYNFYAQFLCGVQKDFSYANQLFQKAIVLRTNTKLAETFSLYGQCLLLQGKTRQAKTAFLNAIKQSNNAPAAYWELANIEYADKQYQSALDFIDRYIQLEGKTKESLTLKMNILQKLGQDNKAATIRLQLSSKVYN